MQLNPTPRPHMSFQTLAHPTCTRTQVRILVSSVGLEVLSLKRVRIGGFRVPKDLGLGGYL